MRLSLLPIPALLVPGAKSALHPVLVYGTSYAGGVSIPEPALLAAVGVALLGISKLLREWLRRS